MPKPVDRSRSSGGPPVALPAALLAVALGACGTPDQRSYEDGWNVYRNQCEDLSARVRDKEVYQTRRERQVLLLDQQNRKVVELEVLANRSGVRITRKRYANDLSNGLISTERLRSDQIQDELDEAIDVYFDQEGKSEEVSYGCLLKGFGAL